MLAVFAPSQSRCKFKNNEGILMSQNMTPSNGVDHALQRLCDASATIGGIVLVAIACVTVVSVIGRAFFSHPILGDVELVQLGCAVVVASFLPYTQFRQANIIVDFFTTNMSTKRQSQLDAFGTLLYTLVMALVSWRVAVGGVDIREAQETSMLMALPLWIPYMLMVPGLVLCTVIGFVQTLQHLGLIAKEEV
jgi:TRAP-type C4-dicarboxylate transport system permease small subunit